MLGSGNTLAPVGAVSWVAPTATATLPSLRVAANPYLTIAGLNVAPPYTIVCVSVNDTNTAFQAILGRNGAVAQPYWYTSAGTTLNAGDGVGQVSLTVDVTKIHCYAFVDGGVSVGGSQWFLDGIPSTTGTMGSVNLTGQRLGGDQALGFTNTGNYYAYGVVARALTTDENLCIASRMRAKYGTP